MKALHRVPVQGRNALETLQNTSCQNLTLASQFIPISRKPRVSSHETATRASDRKPEKIDNENNLVLTSAGPATDEQMRKQCATTLCLKDTRRDGYFCETAAFAEQAEKARNLIMSNATDFKSLTIKKAAIEWLKLREMYVKPGTIRAYVDYIVRLNVFFGEMLVDQIHIGHFQEYQRLFKGQYHPASINHDLNTLSQILRKAGLWQPIAEHYRSLPVPRRPKPRVLTDKEENDFFELAASDRRWYLAYLEASLSNNTTAYGVELRLMQLSDINMEAEQPTIIVPLNVKNEHRPRVIPLNDRGRIMVMRMLERAKSLGSSRPEHHLFPFRVKRGLHDPCRPASPSWTNWQWNALNKRALELKIIPFRVTRRNFRNQPITKMLEAGVPIETVRAVAGHVSDEMTRYYAQHRLTVKADALNLIDPKRKKRPAAISTRGRKGASA